MKAVCMVTSIALATTLSSCSPETNVKYHIYKLVMSVEGKSGKRVYSVVNKVRVGDKYNYAPGMSGTGHTCKADATALVIPMTSGNLIALVDSHSGMNPNWNACQIGRLQMNKPVGEYQMPRMVFVNMGDGIKSSVAVDWKELNRFGFTNASLVAIKTNESVSEIPTLFQKWGCTGRITKTDWTNNPPDCNSLVVRELH